MTGFPRYEEIMDERERRKKQETEGGRQRTLIRMAEGLIDRLRADYKIRDDVILNHEDPDPRKWTITVKFMNGRGEHTESMWLFPSEECLTTIMLVSK